jgi:RNA polymerase sigma-70 factor (ECF subfamily)
MRRTAPAAAKHELTEPEAIRRAQDGDATAFEYLYNSHSRRVYGLCLRMIRNTAEAEDLTQQAFLQVFRKIGTFRGDSVFSTWLHRLTVNIVLMHLRRKTPKEVLFAGSDQPARRQDRQKYPQAMSVLSLARQHS